MKLSITSPITLVLDPPKRTGHVVTVAWVEPLSLVETPDRAVLSGKRAHRAARAYRGKKAQSGRSNAIP